MDELHVKLISITDTEVSRGHQYEVDLISVNLDLKFLEWLINNYPKEMVVYQEEYFEEIKNG